MKRIIQIFIIIGTILLLSYLYRPLHAEMLLKSGVTYINHGYIFKGLADLNRAQEFDPANGKIYFQKGIALGKLSQKRSLQKSREKYIKSSINNFNVAKLYTKDSAVDFYMAAGYESTGDLEKAVLLYEKVIEKNFDYKNINEVKKNLKNVLKKLGDTYYSKGETKSAEKIYKRLIEINGLQFSWGTTQDYEKYSKLMPENLMVHYWLARSYYDKHKWSHALAHFSDIQRLGFITEDMNSMLISVHFQLADQYKEKKNIDQAIKHYLKAAALDPFNQRNIYVRAVFEAGFLYENLNLLDKAKELYLLVEELDTKKGEGYHRIGRMYEKKEMLEDAILMYKKYLPFREASNIAIYITLGSLYERVGSLPEAEETYLLLEEIDTTKGRGFNLTGKMYERKGMLKEAVFYYTKYLPYRGRGDINIFHVLGRLYTELGNLSEAKKVYLKLEETDTQKGHGLLAIAQMYKNKGMRKEGIIFFEKCLGYQKNNSHIYYTLGVLNDEINNIAGAVSAYLKLEEKDEQKGKGIYQIGKLYERRGMLKEALPYFERYIKNKKNSLKTVFTIAGINNKLGNHKKAIFSYKTVIKKDPINSTGLVKESYLALGKLYASLNKEKESVSMYKKYNILKKYAMQ